jgi:hypothetical protein
MGNSITYMNIGKIEANASDKMIKSSISNFHKTVSLDTSRYVELSEVIRKMKKTQKLDHINKFY